MAATIAPSLADRPAEGLLAAKWIISGREDLIWFLGSAVPGYGALALLAMGFPLFPIQAVWMLGIDGPHVLATVTRTYFDRAERRKLGALLWAPVPLVLLGPAMVAVGQGALFFLFAVCWQQFHVVKQHFGFMMLYKGKNRERDRVDFHLDRWLLLSSLFLPLALFVIRTRPAVAAFPGVGALTVVGGCAYGALAIVWLGRQVMKLRARAEMNWPKLMLLALVIPLQWVALLYAAGFGADGIVRAGIALGLFHSIQYHRLMWFHNRNRYGGAEAREKHGFAVSTAASVGAYLLVAIGLHFMVMFLPVLAFPGEMTMAAVWGFAFTHYVLDTKIWHVRADRELAAALGM